MRQPMLHAACLLLAFAPSAVTAQRGEGPVIVIGETEREVRVSAFADGDSDQDAMATPTGGTFLETVTVGLTGTDGSTASGSAYQSTVLASTVIRGELIVSGEAQRIAGGSAEGRVSAASDLFVSFTVPVDTPFTFSGNFTATDDSPGACGASGSAGISGIDANDSVFLLSAGYCDEDPPNEATFSFSGTIGAGEMITVGASADVFWQDADGISFPGDGSVTLDFAFYLGTPEVFADGFESGSTSGWSSTVP